MTSKFTVLNIILRKKFGEFMEFFLKGLNSFKIQIIFILDLFLEFIIQNPEGFGSWTKKETCSICNYLPPCQVSKLLDN
jgi:hypothetical protein